jgi:hypothetical protein
MFTYIYIYIYKLCLLPCGSKSFINSVSPKSLVDCTHAAFAYTLLSIYLVVWSSSKVQGLPTGTIIKFCTFHLPKGWVACLAMEMWWSTSISCCDRTGKSTAKLFGSCTLLLWLQTQKLQHKVDKCLITIFVNLGFFRHFETVTNIRTWIKSHRYWRML